jgi:hypothetical protein
MLKYLLLLLALLCPPAGSAWLYELPPTHVDLSEVRDLVNSYHFTRPWEKDIFDCVDMAAANWRILSAANLSPLIAICPYDGGGLHCYVVFPWGDGWAGLDTRVSRSDESNPLSHSLGTVVDNNLTYYQLVKTPEDLYAIDPRGPPVVTGEVIVPTVPCLPSLFSQ